MRGISLTWSAGNRQVESVTSPSSGLTATFSAGFAQCLGDADLEHAIERADRAMYKAKAEGRNRTLCLEGDAEAATAQDPDPVLP